MICSGPSFQSCLGCGFLCKRSERGELYQDKASLLPDSKSSYLAIHNVVHAAPTWASLGSLQETQNLKPHPRPTEWDSASEQDPQGFMCVLSARVL